MTPDLARIRVLIAVLRSGLIPQGNSYLCRLDADGKVAGMCCLGVASHVAMAFGLDIPLGKILRRRITPDGGDAEVRTYAGAFEYWPAEVSSWYGIEGQNPVLSTPRGDRQTATWLNDCGSEGHGHPLSCIADCFELTYLPEEYYSRYPERKR